MRIIGHASLVARKREPIILNVTGAGRVMRKFGPENRAKKIGPDKYDYLALDGLIALNEAVQARGPSGQIARPIAK